MDTTLDHSGAPAVNAAQRYSIYTAVHKGLRAFMADTLVKVGKMDPYDDCETLQTLEQLRLLLKMCRDHLRHENEFLHPALEQAQRNSALHTADDHVEHEKEIAELQQQAGTVEAASGVARAVATHKLYLALAVFVGENLVHMNVEETDNQAVLIAHYSDAELFAIEGQIIRHIAPEDAPVGQRWMIPHMNAAERLRMFSNARAHAPPEAFAGLLALAREVLSERDWYKLESSLR